MKLKPLNNRVVVKPLEAENKTSGGIVLPDTAKEKSTKGEVMFVGNGRILENGERLPLLVKVGDKVIYEKYAGSEIKIGGVEYKILSESDILVVLE